MSLLNAISFFFPIWDFASEFDSYSFCKRGCSTFYCIFFSIFLALLTCVFQFPQQSAGFSGYGIFLPGGGDLNLVLRVVFFLSPRVYASQHDELQQPIFEQAHRVYKDRSRRSVLYIEGLFMEASVSVRLYAHAIGTGSQSGARI